MQLNDTQKWNFRNLDSWIKHWRKVFKNCLAVKLDGRWILKITCTWRIYFKKENKELDHLLDQLHARITKKEAGDERLFQSTFQ